MGGEQQAGCATLGTTGVVGYDLFKLDPFQIDNLNTSFV